MRLRDKLVVACFIVMVLLGSWRFGGAKMGSTAGGAGPDYGPVNGPQWVRDNAVPIQPSKPAGAQDVAAGSLTQTLLNTAGTGAVFWLLAGTHSVTTALAPLTNQQIWCASGAVIDGGATSSNALIMSSAAGVQIHGGTWRNQGNASSATFAAAILHSGSPGGGSWVIEDVTASGNFNIGITVLGPNCAIRRCKANSNGRYGMSAPTSTVTIEHCEMAFNNTRNLNWGNDAGGTKLGSSAGSGHVVRFNWLHDNTGGGIWYDGSTGGHTIAENVSENNLGWGIFYEVSWGNTSIFRNYLTGNGESAPSTFGAADTLGSWFNAPQLLVSCSDGNNNNSDILIERNEIDANERAMGMINHDSHTSDCKRVKFRTNRVWLRNTASFGGAGGQVGGQDTQVTKTLFTETSNEFSGNEYRVASASFTYWKWGGTGSGDQIDWTAWLALNLNRGNAADTRVLI